MTTHRRAYSQAKVSEAIHVSARLGALILATTKVAGANANAIAEAIDSRRQGRRYSLQRRRALCTTRSIFSLSSGFSSQGHEVLLKNALASSENAPPVMKTKRLASSGQRSDTCR